MIISIVFIFLSIIGILFATSYHRIFLSTNFMGLSIICMLSDTINSEFILIIISVLYSLFMTVSIFLLNLKEEKYRPIEEIE